MSMPAPYGYPPPPRPVPANLGKRFAARLLDFLFAGLMTVAVNLLIVGVGEAAQVPDDGWVYPLAANMIIFPLCYEWLQLALWGTTWGSASSG